MACIMKMMAHNLQNNIDKLHFFVSTAMVNVINKRPIEIFKVPKFSLQQTCHKP
jgi:hypothetical protein